MENVHHGTPSGLGTGTHALEHPVGWLAPSSGVGWGTVFGIRGWCDTDSWEGTGRVKESSLVYVIFHAVTNAFLGVKIICKMTEMRLGCEFNGKFLIIWIALQNAVNLKRLEISVTTHIWISKLMLKCTRWTIGTLGVLLYYWSQYLSLNTLI